MIISTKKGTPQVELDRIVDNFEKQGLSVTLIRGTDYNVFGLVGDTTKIAEKEQCPQGLPSSVRCGGQLPPRGEAFRRRADAWHRSLQRNIL